MARRTFIGGAFSVSMVRTWTISSNTNTHTFILTASHPSGSVSDTVTIVSQTADGVLTTAQIATAIANEWNASNHEYARVVTASAASNVVTFTSDYPGVPFVVAKSGTGTSTLTTTTANNGPTDWSVAGNWLEGVVPVNADDIHLTGSYDILYGLDQSAVTAEQITVKNRSGKIGWPGAPLKIDPDRFVYDSLGVSYIDIGSNTIAPIIHGTAEPANGFGLWIVGTGISTMTVNGGCVGVAMQPADTSTVTTIINNGGSVTVGPDTTLTNCRHIAGYSELRNTANMTLFECLSGAVLDLTTGTCATYAVYGGYVKSRRSGNIGATAAYFYGGTADFLEARTALSISNGVKLYHCTLLRDAATVSGTLTETDALVAKGASEKSLGYGGSSNAGFGAGR